MDDELKVLHYFMQGIVASLPGEARAELDKVKAALENFLSENEKLGKLAVFLKFLEISAIEGEEGFQKSLDSLATP